MAVLSVHFPQTEKSLAHALDLLGVVETRMQSVIQDTSMPLNGVDSIAQQAASFHLASGGQRIRAQLALHASLALGIAVDDAVAIAASSELVHNASLVHDDLQDRDTTRHGVATVWAAHGDGVAICTGDLLLSTAYCALAGVSQPKLLPALMAMLHRCISDASKGQCADLTSQCPRVVTLQDYENLAALKSGSLLGLPIEMALKCCARESSLALARHAARSFAIGYQIFDDLNDVQRDLSRNTPHPATNAVAVLQSLDAGVDAPAQARQLALRHLTIAAQSSELLPRGSGERLQLLARNLSARIIALHP